MSFSLPRGFFTALLMLGLVGLVAVAFRPGIVLGVDGPALAESVGESGSSQSCVQTGDKEWSCNVKIQTAAREVEFDVTTRSFGCWDAVEVGQPAGQPGLTESGCINLLDVLST